MIRYRLYGNLRLQGIKKAFNAICVSTSKQLKLSNNYEFDVNIVHTKKIQTLNKKYRKINKPTDVLSFANRDNGNIHISLLGEIYICLEKAKKQAKQYKHSLQREMIFLFTHGLLHLLGYDHKTKKQEKALNALTNKIINKAQIVIKYTHN